MNHAGKEAVMWALGHSQPETATGQKEFTFLAKDVVFRGTMTLEGNVRVDGRIEGEVHSTGLLTIGEHAVIIGNIMAETVIANGKIKGDIIASEKITLLPPGIVIGDIRTPVISIEAGAIFHGLSEMEAATQVEDHRVPSEKIHDLAVYQEKQRDRAC
jgi:cytoskeletal protein CcmA (bactofilin family)